MKAVIDKYLATYSDERIKPYLPALQSTPPFDACVIVPAYNEAAYFQDLLKSLEKAAEFSHSKVLAIVVVNHKVSTKEEDKKQNRLLLENLKTHFHPQLKVLPLDFVSKEKEFHEKEGVGHARKNGSDLALFYFISGKIKAPYFHTTDGDALVPLDYFEVVWPLRTSALVANYTHIPSGDPLLDEAHALYEYSLRHYENGLLSAGSPYAFPTIGSLLSISFEHYAMVRGFPKRLAAEDFYILNKLAKVGNVEKRPATVQLRSRPSDRVPFGTGMGVADILSEGIEHFTLYHPDIFLALKSVLHILNDFPDHRSIPKARQALGNSILKRELEKLEFFTMLENAAASRPNKDDCRRHLHTAFDAFKTLKFVHAMRDHAYPNVGYSGIIPCGFPNAGS